MAVFTTLALTAGATGLTALGVAVAGAAVYGAIGGVVNARKAGKAQQAAAEKQARAQELQAKRQRRAAIRSNILASARARASAQAAGTAQSSGLAGGTGAGRSALGAELGFGTQMSGLSSEISMFQGQAARYKALSDTGFGVAKLGMQAFGTFSGLQGTPTGSTPPQTPANP